MGNLKSEGEVIAIYTLKVFMWSHRWQRDAEVPGGFQLVLTLLHSVYLFYLIAYNLVTAAAKQAEVT